MRRPTSVFVLGILNIVFGVWGICGAGSLVFIAVFFQWMAKLPGSQQDAVIDRMVNGPYVVFMWISAPLQLIFAVLLIAAGIGLFKMRPWARTASLVYAVYTILMTFISLALVWIFVYLPVLRMNLPPMQTVSIYTGTVGALVGLIYPGCLIFFLTRPHVLAAFAGTDQPPTGEIGRYVPVSQDAGNPYRSPR